VVSFLFQMNSSVYIFFILFFKFSLLVSSQETPSTKTMSDTIFSEMNNFDPNERVQVGSYRVDGHGHQQLKDVTFIFLLFNYIHVRFQNEITSNVRSNEKFTLKLRLFSRSHSESVRLRMIVLIKMPLPYHSSTTTMSIRV
jgi:hypothetical protein